jgi:hypothetical protein
MVHYQIKGPAGASVVIDGLAVGTTPLVLALAARTAPRALVVHSNGVVAVRRSLPGDRDVSLTLPPKPRRVTTRSHGSDLNPFH